ncbi:MAG: MmgE/PrpD family protein [Burkholderiales bacterium]
MTITRSLAQLIVASSSSDLPSSAIHAAKRSVVNWLAAALGGSRDDSVQRALAAVSEFAGPAQCTVIGHAQRLDLLNAALVNGISSNILDFDDAHARLVLHPTAVLGCALLALSETRRVTGLQFLHALILGVEVESRLLDPSVAEYKFAWSPTATVGGIAAAAACSRALGLTEHQTTWALGIAATQASGLRESGGSMSKAFDPGHVARCGLTAALFAAKDFTGSETILEGPKGFLAAFGQVRDADSIVSHWGEQYQIALNTFKAYPCGMVGQAVADAGIGFHREGVRSEDIVSMRLTVAPVTSKMMGRTTLRSFLDAKLSVHHIAAVALIHGKAGVKEFELAAIEDPEAVRLREHSSLVVRDSARGDEAELELTLRSGRVLKKHIEHATGGLEHPITDAGLEQKLRGLAQGVLPAPGVDRLLALMWSLEKIDDAAELARAVQVS